MKLSDLRILIILIIAAVLLAGCSAPSDKDGEATANETEKMSVHFIDVGQADSILIVSGEHAMLVDAGTNDGAETVENYLKSVGIKKLDYVIGTHPHEDHIGGLDTVINRFDVACVIMPKIMHNTKTFEDVLDAVADKGLKLTAPEVGSRYDLGGGYFTVLGPARDHGDELNNWSVGIKIVFGKTSFVMCGDAETEAEEDFLRSGINLDADVLKLSHHGSSTSTGDDFLKAVSPDAVVISCGADNSYGHPHKETLEKIAGLEVYRTDKMGTVTATSDGENITWDTAPIITEKAEGTAYVLNTNTKKIHLPDCGSVESISAENREDVKDSRDELIAAGYEPCGRCKP